ncbi:MAG: peptidoglycan DD-metalloendopeptidase family protein [Bacteroidetes bacterium]|nr:peptidoglycan DD-metalloendopeptidase family protein [Bacteroidota bacterium]MDA0943588.1 peptidoglycan DD-metalloendopeptidase family protein [Bacteroidota bacterium]MDA1111791.1 peptidoglycan DD-metalloendopeptidase family protein [Bacteroidota bacterium]
MIWIAAFWLVNSLHAQSRSSLEKKRKKAESDIAANRKILKTTQKEKKATLYRLNALNQIIVQSEQLLRNLQEEVQVLDLETQNKQKELDRLQFAYEKERVKLKRTIIQAYKTRKGGQEVAFLLSAKNIRQVMRRMKFLRKLSDFRRHQIASINAQAEKVQTTLAELNQLRKERYGLLGNQRLEMNRLENDKKSKQQMVTALTGKEAELKKRIEKNRAKVAQLNKEISKAIAREIERERQRQAAKNSAPKSSGTAKSSPSSSTLTPEARALSADFVNNKGGLPWPVERGFISQSFGTHQHPDLPGITTINNGVDITTQSGGEARCVFKGKVSAILTIPGQGQAVLVNHGEYFTVYTRLSKVYVAKGQELSSGTKLGQVMTDEEGRTILNFQVWLGQAKQNPASWIRGR